MTDLRDGRYEGGNRDFLVDVRIDMKGSGLISADLFRAAAPGHEHVASVQIEQDGEPSATGTWRAFFEAYDGATAGGTVTVAPGDGDVATVTFHADRALNVLPARTDVTIDVRWTAVELRRLGLEVETEERVEVPETFSVGGRDITFAGLLSRAGLQVREVGLRTVIPRNDDGWEWDESDVYGVLDELMRSTADDGLVLPAWKIHMLRLGRPVKQGMFGVMFDLTSELPRQGCAVFVDSIRDWTPQHLWDQRILHTMAHEVGHAFNLVHRFESEVGCSGSPSVMNYPDEFRPGGEEQFWLRCLFGFDDDELAFLRHGPRSAVMPGAAPFHSFGYWSAAALAAQAHGEPSSGAELQLTPPKNNSVFEYGQPIYLQVSLRNNGPEPIRLPLRPLDIKAGNLQILVERAPAFGRRPVAGEAFVPMVRRCLAVGTDDAPAPEPLRATDDPLTDNVNLAFGGTSMPLADPGEYRLTPVLSLPDGSVVRGRTLRIWIDRPARRRDERLAERLFHPEVGAWFTLGGSHVLRHAHDEIRDVLAERARDRVESPRPDPIAAAISRSLGIHASRSYLRMSDQGFRRGQANLGVATRMLRGLVTDAHAGSCFDEATLASTNSLVTRLEREERNERD